MASWHQSSGIAGHSVRRWRTALLPCRFPVDKVTYLHCITTLTYPCCVRLDLEVWCSYPNHTDRPAGSNLHMQPNIWKKLQSAVRLNCCKRWSTKYADGVSRANRRESNVDSRRLEARQNATRHPDLSLSVFLLLTNAATVMFVLYTDPMASSRRALPNKAPCS